jgi:MarR family transcriptional regulator, transcriptional regulator for hemolysin
MQASRTLHDRFGYRIAVLVRRWRALVDAELAAYGLSQATWRPLIHLASFPEPPRQCELAEALQLGCPALVRLIDRLEEGGLVERVVDGDRRANKVRLTRSGKKLASRVDDIIAAVERDLLRDLSAGELAQSVRAIESIEGRIERYQPRTRRRRA